MYNKLGTSDIYLQNIKEMFLTLTIKGIKLTQSTFQPRPPPRCPGPSGQGEQRVEVAMAGLSLGMVIEGGRDTMQKVTP